MKDCTLPCLRRQPRLAIPETATRLLGLFLIITATQASAQNLIHNGGWEDMWAPGVPIAWNLNSYNTNCIDFPESGGNTTCLLNQDPSGLGFYTAYRMVDQQMVNFPFGNDPPDVVIFSGQIAIPPGSPATPNSLQFEIHFFNSMGFQIVQIPLDPVTIPDDGQLYPVQGSLPFAPGFFSSNNFNTAYFAVSKNAPGEIHIDDLLLEPGAPPRIFDMSPVRGPVTGGTEVIIQSPGPIDEPYIMFGDRGAKVLDRQDNQVTVLSPPVNRPGPVEVHIMTEGGEDTPIPDPFFYDPPLGVHTFRPRTISPNSPDPLYIHGSGFQPDTVVRIDGQPIPPGDMTIDTEIIALKLTSIEPLDIGPVDIEVTNPDGQVAIPISVLQVNDPPVVTSVYPDYGPFSGGTYIEIRGQNLQSDALIVDLNGQPLVDVQQPSDDLITGYTPPDVDGPGTIYISSQDGVWGEWAAAFDYNEPVPGDFNDDGEVSIDDYRYFHGALLDDSLSSGNPDADVNGDGRLDLLDAHIILQQAANPNNIQFPRVTEPGIFVPGLPPPQGYPVDFRVRNLGESNPCVIDWGDGTRSSVGWDRTVPHTYDLPGTYTVTMESETNITEPQTITIPDLKPVDVISIDLEMSGIDIDSNPIDGLFVQLDPVNDPPVVSATLTGTGSGTVHGTVVLDSSADGADLHIPFSAEFPAEPAGEKTVQVNLGAVPQNPGETHIVSVEVNHGANIQTEAAGVPPLVLQIPSFVSEVDCRELERQWKALVVAREAKCADCEALEKQLQQLNEELAAKEADKPVKEQDLQDWGDERDSIQNDLDQMIERINAFLGPNGNVQTYTSQDDFPPGTNHVGSKRSGSSTGVGLSFVDDQQALDGIANYESAMGTSYGADMAAMRQMLKNIEDLDSRIQGKEQELSDLNASIDDLKNDKIPAKEQELANCQADCETLGQQIETLVQAHQECLKQLDDQRKSASGLGRAERVGSRLQNQSDRVNSSGDRAENLVDSRGGSPDQVAGDEGDVETGKSKQGQAQSQIDYGKELLRQARAALSEGDTEAADDLTAQAQDAFDTAKTLLDEAQGYFNSASSSARARKRRECSEECEGQDRITEQRFKVYNQVLDMSIVLIGYTPEKWASFNENAKEAIEGLELVSKIADWGGDYSPISGAVTPNVGKTATAVVGAYVSYASNWGLDVWVKHRGHTVIKRTIHRCVNGYWKFIRVETEELDDEFEQSKKIGSIPAGTAKNDRSHVVEQLLAQYNRSMRVVRSGSPSVSQPECQ